MNALEIMRNRYSAKEFDSSKTFSEQQLNELKELLTLAPSSVNLQPWGFVIATSDEAKAKIAKSTENQSFNTQKILDASVVVVFAVKTDVTEEHLRSVIDKEDADGRYPNDEIKEQMYNGRKYYANFHKSELKDLKSWFEKQLYINLGTFLLGTAAMGIDSLAMEGFDPVVLDQELNLAEKGLSSVVLVSVGFHKDTDYNFKAPKSRLTAEDIIEVI